MKFLKLIIQWIKFFFLQKKQIVGAVYLFI